MLSAYYPHPPAKFVFADEEGQRRGFAIDSMVSEGCIISGGHVERSILSPRVRVNSYAHVHESILFDGVEVGRHARIRRAILDKGIATARRTTLALAATIVAVLYAATFVLLRRMVTAPIHRLEATVDRPLVERAPAQGRGPRSHVRDDGPRRGTTGSS